MTTRYQRAALPKPEQVEHLFNAEVISRLAQEAKVPEEKIPDFGNGICCAVKDYLQYARWLDAGEVRGAIEKLSREVFAAIEGQPGAIEKAADTLATLPGQAWSFLDNLASAFGDSVPAPSDLLNSEQGRDGLISLAGLCGHQAHIVPGRRRPGGKQSRPTIKKVVVSPPVRRRHPPNTSELILCAALGLLYNKFTGRFPERYPYKGVRPPDHGPFVRLVQATLDHIGISGSADDLVRAYLAAMKN